MFSNSNPGLQEYDLTHYKGLNGRNFLELDTAIKRIFERYTTHYSESHKKDVWNHIYGYGELVGGILNELTEACHKEGKYGEIAKYDRNGNRIDEVVYSKEQIESRKISYKYGIVNLNYHSSWKHKFSRLHRYILTYLNNLNGEGGVACPLAMTDGMIYILENLGTEEQKKKYLPLVAGEHSSSYFMAGQYVTERVGGSNVLANRTVAKKLNNGKWLLNGEKWFCSNPGDLWVTTAKVEGTNTVGLFLVSRFKENGELNGHHLLRKKDIIGSRGKVTAEAIYQDLEAEELGRPAHGIANLMEYVINISRLHVAVGACGNARRAVMEAIEYSKWRTAYHKKISDFPIFSKELAEIQTLQTALTFATFRYIDCLDQGSVATDILAPLMKYKSSAQATKVTHSAILCLGGNGIIGDYSPLARLHNDSIINETWEGTHFIITEHFIRAFNREKRFKAFLEVIDENLSGVINLHHLHPILDHCEHLKKQLVEIFYKESKEWKEVNRFYIADLAYNCFALSELLEEAKFDYKPNSIYFDFATAFSEIISTGNNGRLPSHSIFMNPEKVNRLIQY